MVYDFLTLDDLDVSSKTIFLRADINSPLDPASKRILDATRIEAITPTIKDLSEAIGLGLNFGLFGHAEYEILSLESRYFEIGAPPDAVGRFNLHSVLIGGGIYQPIGRRAGFLIMVLWNLNETASSPYSNPIFRIGFNF